MKNNTYNIDKKEDNDDIKDLNTKDLTIILGEIAKLDNNNNSKKDLDERFLI